MTEFPQKHVISYRANGMEEKSLLDSVNVRPPHGMARHINGKMMIWDAISNGVI